MGLAELKRNYEVWRPKYLPPSVENYVANLEAECARLRNALKHIAECKDAPDINATGEWQTGLHCGVEDRDCQDRYEGADYGHTVGVSKSLEWASNEAKHALSMVVNCGGPKEKV